MSAALWTYPEVAAALGGRLVGAAPDAFSAVSFDSREVTAGTLFFAIRGVREDGHRYVVDALQNGAALAVVSQPTPAMERAGALLVVDDTLDALRDLARAARARAAGRVIAVTGSVGKTTTKEMLKLAFAATGRVHAAEKSFNNHWGVPLTLARMPRDTDVGIIEIGMNAPGEIAPLARLAKPDVAVVTAIAESHLGAFAGLGGLAGIAAEKAAIFGALAEGGVAVFNADAPHADILHGRATDAGAADIITYGERPGAEVRLLEAVDTTEGVSLRADARGRVLSFAVGMPGRHVALNALAVIAAGLALDADLTALARALAAMRPPPGRGGRARLEVAGGEALLIDESYNANPASMRAALRLLAAARPAGGGRRVAVLGDMLELGDDAARLHAALADDLAACGVDVLYAAGEMMQLLFAAAPREMRGAHVAAADDLPDLLQGALTAGDVVLIKGSNGSGMWRVARALKERLGGKGGAA